MSKFNGTANVSAAIGAYRELVKACNRAACMHLGVADVEAYSLASQGGGRKELGTWEARLPQKPARAMRQLFVKRVGCESGTDRVGYGPLWQGRRSKRPPFSWASSRRRRTKQERDQLDPGSSTTAVSRSCRLHAAAVTPLRQPLRPPSIPRLRLAATPSSRELTIPAAGRRNRPASWLLSMQPCLTRHHDYGDGYVA